METIYKSRDGNHFSSKHQCKKYEEALDEIEIIDHLLYEEIDGQRFYKINSEAELYFFDHLGGDSDKTLYDIFEDLKSATFRFPIWIHEDGQKTKGSMIKEMSDKIDGLQDAISKIRENISKLEALDSRKKTPVIEAIEKEKKERPKKEPHLINDSGSVKKEVEEKEDV